ncbi:MAG TPA: DUF1343 domain-containing protein [Verrucomicrobiota bacterium]|nr:DUF1343 domain-containing protein [Verrucomicrobiota bacterium]
MNTVHRLGLSRTASSSPTPTARKPASSSRHEIPRSGSDRRALVLGLVAAFILVIPSGCRTDRPEPKAPAAKLAAAFDASKLAEMDAAIEAAIADKRCPGGVLWLERNGVAYRKAYGRRAVFPSDEAMTEDTIFDAASLTKVMACTPAVMRLVEKGRLQLDAPVSNYLPEFKGDGKEAITVRQLLTHTSGLRPDVGLKPDWTGTEAAIELACAEKLRARPGEQFIYSDTGPILLGEVVRRVTGQPLDQFLAREVYGPLRMKYTGFNPPEAKLPRVAPTEIENGQPVRGVVHDPRARRMGGVAGHAGLFTTAADAARYSRMMLNEGKLDGVRVFQPETVRLMTSVQTPPHVTARRGLGWDLDSAYAGPRGAWFPAGSYGHTGWTGTSLWIDPFSRTFVIFLSNRNHPDESGSVTALRRKLGTLAAEAVRGYNFVYVPGALPALTNAPSARASNADANRAVLNGVDVLVRQEFKPLQGLRVGLISNHTGHDRQRNATIDLLRNAPGVSLKVLFSPEHGIRGQLDEKVGDSVDAQTGLPVYSLYGEVRQPKPEQLRDLDALVFDIQDIGCRFYTYISTMGLCMEAAAKAGLKFFVLDRVNPIGGIAVDGPVHTGSSTFTAFHPIPVRHGMTVGELARMFNAERGFKCDLTVVPVEGWSRAQWLDQTGLPWTNPSPNMRSLTEAALYPGIGLLETTALSVGRGTGTPFEIIGAPYIDDLKLAEELTRAALPGVRFVPVRFTPNASVFKDKACAGVQIFLTDRDRCEVIDVGITIAQTLHRLYPRDFAIAKFNNLLQHPSTIEAIRAGKSLRDIRRLWLADLAAFKQRRSGFLMYE